MTYCILTEVEKLVFFEELASKPFLIPKYLPFMNAKYFITIAREIADPRWGTAAAVFVHNLIVYDQSLCTTWTFEEFLIIFITLWSASYYSHGQTRTLSVRTAFAIMQTVKLNATSTCILHRLFECLPPKSTSEFLLAMTCLGDLNLQRQGVMCKILEKLTLDGHQIAAVIFAKQLASKKVPGIQERIENHLLKVVNGELNLAKEWFASTACKALIDCLSTQYIPNDNSKDKLREILRISIRKGYLNFARELATRIDLSVSDISDLDRLLPEIGILPSNLDVEILLAVGKTDIMKDLRNLDKVLSFCVKKPELRMAVDWNVILQTLTGHSDYFEPERFAVLTYISLDCMLQDQNASMSNCAVELLCRLLTLKPEFGLSIASRLISLGYIENVLSGICSRLLELFIETRSVFSGWILAKGIASTKLFQFTKTQVSYLNSKMSEFQNSGICEHIYRFLLLSTRESTLSISLVSGLCDATQNFEWDPNFNDPFYNRFILRLAGQTALFRRPQCIDSHFVEHLKQLDEQDAVSILVAFCQWSSLHVKIINSGALHYLMDVNLDLTGTRFLFLETAHALLSRLSDVISIQYPNFVIKTLKAVIHILQNPIGLSHYQMQRFEGVFIPSLLKIGNDLLDSGFKTVLHEFILTICSKSNSTNNRVQAFKVISAYIADYREHWETVTDMVIAAMRSEHGILVSAGSDCLQHISADPDGRGLLQSSASLKSLISTKADLTTSSASLLSRVGIYGNLLSCDASGIEWALQTNIHAFLSMTLGTDSEIRRVVENAVNSWNFSVEKLYTEEVQSMLMRPQEFRFESLFLIAEESDISVQLMLAKKVIDFLTNCEVACLPVVEGTASLLIRLLGHPDLTQFELLENFINIMRSRESLLLCCSNPLRLIIASITSSRCPERIRIVCGHILMLLAHRDSVHHLILPIIENVPFPIRELLLIECLSSNMEGIEIPSLSSMSMYTVIKAMKLSLSALKGSSTEAVSRSLSELFFFLAKNAALTSDIRCILFLLKAADVTQSVDLIDVISQMKSEWLSHENITVRRWAFRLFYRKIESSAIARFADELSLSKPCYLRYFISACCYQGSQLDPQTIITSMNSPDQFCDHLICLQVVCGKLGLEDKTIYEALVRIGTRAITRPDDKSLSLGFAALSILAVSNWPTFFEVFPALLTESHLLEILTFSWKLQSCLMTSLCFFSVFLGSALFNFRNLLEALNSSTGLTAIDRAIRSSDWLKRCGVFIFGFINISHDDQLDYKVHHICSTAELVPDEDIHVLYIALRIGTSSESVSKLAKRYISIAVNCGNSKDQKSYWSCVNLSCALVIAKIPPRTDWQTWAAVHFVQITQDENISPIQSFLPVFPNLKKICSALFLKQLTRENVKVDDNHEKLIQLTLLSICKSGDSSMVHKATTLLSSRAIKNIR